MISKKKSSKLSFRFPKLHEKIIDVVTQLLRRRLPTTNVMVENLVAIELAYINTKHPDFHKDAALVPSLMKNENLEGYHRRNLTSRTASPAVIQQQMVNGDVGHHDVSILGFKTKVLQTKFQMDPQQTPQSHWLQHILPPAQKDSLENSAANTPIHTIAMSPVKAVNLLPDVPVNNNARRLTDKEQKDCDVIGKFAFAFFSFFFKFCFLERLIKSYFYIVRKSIQDSVPKAVMHFLVNYVQENLQSELVTHLYKSDSEDLLNESDHIAIRRKEAGDMLKVSLLLFFIIETLDYLLCHLGL